MSSTDGWLIRKFQFDTMWLLNAFTSCFTEWSLSVALCMVTKSQWSHFNNSIFSLLSWIKECRSKCRRKCPLNFVMKVHDSHRNIRSELSASFCSTSLFFLLLWILLWRFRLCFHRVSKGHCTHFKRSRHPVVLHLDLCFWRFNSWLFVGCCIISRLSTCFSRVVLWTSYLCL